MCCHVHICVLSYRASVSDVARVTESKMKRRQPTPSYFVKRAKSLLAESSKSRLGTSPGKWETIRLSEGINNDINHFSDSVTQSPRWSTYMYPHDLAILHKIHCKFRIHWRLGEPWLQKANRTFNIIASNVIVVCLFQDWWRWTLCFCLLL